MPKLFCLLLLLTFGIDTFAQRDTGYNSKQNKLQNEIWTNAPAQFRVSDIPAAMNNESAVIIARSIVVINSSDKKVLSGLQTSPVISDRAIWHERIKINDKAALERYSSTTYTKEFNRTFRYQSMKIHDTMRNYFSAKVIKPDDSETIVNNNEEVITKNEHNEQQAKIAISGLQTGDILDYYIVSEVVQQARGSVRGPYTFFLQYDYPILYYYAKFQFDSETGVEYINANGAPDLKQSYNENGDIILGLALKNLPKTDDSLFTSPLRQYPYIKLQFKFVSKGEDLYTHFKRGVVKHGSLTDDLLEQFRQMYRARATANVSPANKMENYFGEVLKIKDVPTDSIIQELYNDYRYTTFCHFPSDDIDVSSEINYRYANSLSNAIYFSWVLTKLSIPNTLYLICSRYGNSLNNVMNISDFDALVKVSGTREHWISFDDIVTQLDEIPARLQGEEAITFTVEKNSSTYTMGKAKVPVSSPSDNEVMENIVVQFDSTDIQSLLVDRKCKQTGALRHADQKKLLLMEDMEAILANPLTQKNRLERLNYKKKNESIAEEYLIAFEKERNNTKTYFTEEITDHFNTAPKDLKGYKIVEPAILASTSFEYTSIFGMMNFVKKAGDNFILDAGKLMGSYNKIDERDRNRRIDIFMFCPRIYRWNITINIPKGYKIKGIENFNKEVKNETGSFNCVAESDNHKVEIKTALTYNHNFENSANWSKLVELTNAVYNLSTQKLLLEKMKL